MRKVAFILSTVLLITKCVSTPIPYDTARIDDSKAFVGVSVQGMDSKYHECDAWGCSTEYYEITFLRGDLGVSFIKRENFEFGLQGGIAGGEGTYGSYGDYILLPNPYRYFGVSMFSYLKWAKSSDRDAISLKLSPGIQGGYTINDGTFFAFPQLLADLMFGGGNPEVLTLGISLRLDPEYAVVSPYASLHLGDFTFSVLYGYGPQIAYANIGYISTLHFGVAKKFK